MKNLVYPGLYGKGIIYQRKEATPNINETPDETTENTESAAYKARFVFLFFFILYV
jgi:hypothetical protein